MANTFSQIYIQTVFAVSGRLSLIHQDFKEDLYKYITGIVRNNGHKLITINGMPGHVHILIGLKPVMALADLVRDIKADSSNFINKNNWLVASSVGRKATGLSLTDTRSSIRSSGTFRIRKRTICGVLSKMSIWHYCESSTLLSMTNTCSSSSNDLGRLHDAPGRRSSDHS